MEEQVRARYLTDVDYFATLLEESPSSRAFYPLALAYYKLEKYDVCVTLCRDGLEIHPGYLAAKTLLAQSLVAVGEVEEAKSLLMDVVSVTDDNYAAYKLLGDLLVNGEDPAKAIPFYRAAHLCLPEDKELKAKLEALIGEHEEEEEEKATTSLYETEETTTFNIDPQIQAAQRLINELLNEALIVTKGDMMKRSGFTLAPVEEGSEVAEMPSMTPEEALAAEISAAAVSKVAMTEAKNYTPEVTDNELAQAITRHELSEEGHTAERIAEIEAIIEEQGGGALRKLYETAGQLTGMEITDDELTAAIKAHASGDEGAPEADSGMVSDEEIARAMAAATAEDASGGGLVSDDELAAAFAAYESEQQEGAAPEEQDMLSGFSFPMGKDPHALEDDDSIAADLNAFAQGITADDLLAEEEEIDFDAAADALNSALGGVEKEEENPFAELEELSLDDLMAEEEPASTGDAVTAFDSADEIEELARSVSDEAAQAFADDGLLSSDELAAFQNELADEPAELTEEIELPADVLMANADETPAEEAVTAETAAPEDLLPESLADVSVAGDVIGEIDSGAGTVGGALDFDPFGDDLGSFDDDLGDLGSLDDLANVDENDIDESGELIQKAAPEPEPVQEEIPADITLPEELLEEMPSELPEETLTADDAAQIDTDADELSAEDADALLADAFAEAEEELLLEDVALPEELLEEMPAELPEDISGERADALPEEEPAEAAEDTQEVSLAGKFAQLLEAEEDTPLLSADDEADELPGETAPFFQGGLMDEISAVADEQPGAEDDAPVIETSGTEKEEVPQEVRKEQINRLEEGLKIFGRKKKG